MADLSKAKANDAEPFDIVSEYLSLLSSDPELSPSIAAIESLIALLASTPATTISETLDLLSRSSSILRSSIPNSVGLSAGTDLFQRYLVQCVNPPSTGLFGTGTGTGSGSDDGDRDDFGHLRQHLLSNGRLFVQQAKKARARIAHEGRPFIRKGSTILTNGGSRVVSTLLVGAAVAFAEDFAFRVIHVLPRTDPSKAKTTIPSPPSPPPGGAEGHQAINALRSRSIPVSVIPYSAVATVLPRVDLVLVGAESVVENGGIITRLGTHQISLLARAMGKPVSVAAESYKFTRLLPLDTADLPVKQKIVDFSPVDDDYTLDGSTRLEHEGSSSGSASSSSSTSSSSSSSPPPPQQQQQQRQQRQKQIITNLDTEAVDFTPPSLISSIITENGVLTPCAVSEELVKLWF